MIHQLEDVGLMRHPVDSQNRHPEVNVKRINDVKLGSSRVKKKIFIVIACMHLAKIFPELSLIRIIRGK